MGSLRNIAWGTHRRQFQIRTTAIAEPYFKTRFKDGRVDVPEQVIQDGGVQTTAGNTLYIKR